MTALTQIDTNVDYTRIEEPLFFVGTVESIDSCTQLEVRLCSKPHAVQMCRTFHSRLPNTQSAPWQFAFKAHYQGYSYAAALWNNPCARGLPNHWLELRRMVVTDDAPRYTASYFLGAMRRFFAHNMPEREKLISYQDQEVHTGTIYKASNWYVDAVSQPRYRPKEGYTRPGTKRGYRTDINGKDASAAGKIRWAIDL